VLAVTVSSFNKFYLDGAMGEKVTPDIFVIVISSKKCSILESFQMYQFEACLIEIGGNWKNCQDAI